MATLDQLRQEADALKNKIRVSYQFMSVYVFYSKANPGREKMLSLQVVFLAK